MPKSYNESLNNYKDNKNLPITENSKISFKKHIIKHKKEWVLEYHYTENNRPFKWCHGWHIKNCYKKEKQVKQALEHLQRANTSGLYDAFRIYNINKKPSSYE